MTPLLEVRGLSKRFALPRRSLFAPRDWLTAVDGVDFRVFPGEAVGLVGESGCGKSTLARLICRLIAPTSGQILLDGDDIGTIAPRRFSRMPHRRDIQMVFQDPSESLNPRFTVFDLIADPLRCLLPALSRTALRARVVAAAAEVNLSVSHLGRLPHQLSLGQKARVGIARAIAVGPKLLVLDEPTSSLDVSVQGVVLQLLDRLRRERGITLFLVSHNLNVVRLLCERVLVMQQGRVVESGAAARIYTNPTHPYTQALLGACPRLHRPE